MLSVTLASYYILLNRLMSLKKVIINIEGKCCPLSYPTPSPWKTATSTGPPLSLLSFLSRYSYYPRFFVFTMSTTIFQLIPLHSSSFLLTTTLTNPLRLLHDNIYITNKKLLLWNYSQLHLTSFTLRHNYHYLLMYSILS